jgi:hypothetical protein
MKRGASTGKQTEGGSAMRNILGKRSEFQMPTILVLPGNASICATEKKPVTNASGTTDIFRQQQHHHHHHQQNY